MARHDDADHNGVADYAEDDRRPGMATAPERFEPLAGWQARAAGPVIYGPDIHPTFQAGISIEQIAKEGHSFLAVKASQGTSTSWAAGAKAWLDRADATGMVTYCYHYLTTDDPAAQARAAKAACFGRPVMVDVEDGSGTVANLRAFLVACSSVGVRVPLVYLPRWYHQQIGSPSLAGLPPIVSSRYLTVAGLPASIYAQVPAAFWDSYGSGTTVVLQFTDRGTVAGQRVDVNAYRGTKDQFRALVYGAPAPVTALPPSGGDDDMPLNITFYDDQWNVDLNGLNFQAAEPVEVPPDSGLNQWAVIRWGAVWGAAAFRIVANGHNGPLGEPTSYATDYWFLPAGTRSVTIEGRRDSPRVVIAARLVEKRA